MADFTPTYTQVQPRGPFHFWAQKVLPTVYDDSLSYYELLTKVVQYLNQNVDDINSLNTNVENIYQAYLDLQNYVNNYFDSQDFQQMVSDKVDEMAENGTLTLLIKAYIDPLFDEETAYIDTRLGSQDSAIESAVESQNQSIALLQAEMTNFVADHAGLTTETVLWSGLANAVGDEITLSDSPSNYNYIDVHYTLRDTAYPRHVQRFDAATFDNAHMGNGCVISLAFSDNATASSETLKCMSIKLQGSTLDDKKFTIATANGWSWNGASASDATNYVPTVHTESGYTAGQIVKIVGVSEEQADTEIIDARVGFDGTIYDTLGEAIREQIETLEEEIESGIPTSGQYTLTYTGNSYYYNLDLKKNNESVSNIRVDQTPSPTSNNLVTSTGAYKAAHWYVDSTGKNNDPTAIIIKVVRVDPFILYDIGYVNSVSIDFGPSIIGDDGYEREYRVRFAIPAGVTPTVNLPSGVRMQTGFNPTGGHTYEVKIYGSKLATFTEW